MLDEKGQNSVHGGWQSSATLRRLLHLSLGQRSRPVYEPHAEQDERFDRHLFGEDERDDDEGDEWLDIQKDTEVLRSYKPIWG